ncbi:MAG: hypothetical protein LWX83_05265 [Anaerolineae bacterium]|nr:hypothetical protein [Anaerolineae bacterium]
MKKTIYSLVSFCLLLALTACSAGEASIQGKGETAAAYTMVAILTQSAYETVVAQLTEVSAKVTPSPEQSPSPTINTTPSPKVTAPVVALVTEAAGAYTPVAGTGCNWASFVKDVTYPDGTGVNPGQQFTKTWRLKNIGTCAWSTAYKLVYAGGNDMQASREIPLSVAVPVGGTVDVSVDLTAPQLPGSYNSYWMLQSDKNELFGIGNNGKNVFYVNVRVGGSSNAAINTAFYMAGSVCMAGWFSTKGVLTCPGSASTSTGAVYKLDSITMEGGIKKSLPAIISIPNSGSDGKITGQFPAYQVQSGDHFRTTIGCLDGHSACDVIFQISYVGDDGTAHSLGSWGHTLDGYNQEVDIDLSNLAGSSIQMILSVYNNGSSDDDYAFWLDPVVSP